MTTLRLHDPARRPPEWTGHLSATQVAVFLRDAKSEVEVDPGGRPLPRGSPSVCYVFETLAEAERFCQERVSNVEHLLCDIYDRRGKIYPIRSYTSRKHMHRVPNRGSALRMIGIAWILIVVTPLMFWIDYRKDGTLVVPTVVGFACFVTALRLLYWGHSELDHLKHEKIDPATKPSGSADE
jgi:hypothetical protein